MRITVPRETHLQTQYDTFEGKEEEELLECETCAYRTTRALKT